MKSFSVMANELILAVSAASWVARTFACRRTTAPQFKTGEKMRPRALVLLAACTFAGAVVWGPTRSPAAEESRFAHADSRSRYVHWIDLYDVDNRRITPESTRPYSPLHTCGRCHDHTAISHGWHFNAFDDTVPAGRTSEPWIWIDERTGTQLPLSYRKHPQMYDPRELGISAWEMTVEFGDRVPGGGFAVASAPADATEEAPPKADRWRISGVLENDCLVCHATSGGYDMTARREQIQLQNHAWAPTAAIHLGSVQGRADRLPDNFDPSDTAQASKLPQVTYDPRRFDPAGKVFVDLIRKPDNNACYQCHSQQDLSTSRTLQWQHDQDVHLRAGISCVDCHRNGIDHHTVRGFEGEVHPSGQSVATLSCAGCHISGDPNAADPAVSSASLAVSARPGRFGAPLPAHAGIPAVHFDILSCTSCHSGTPPSNEPGAIMTSLAHALGTATHRQADQLPLLRSPVYMPLNTADVQAAGDAEPVNAHAARAKLHPHRVMWPAFWGRLDGDQIVPLHPESVYNWTRRALRVRRDFVAEVSAQGIETFNQKVLQALAAIAEQIEGTPVYVSAGKVYRADDSKEQLLSQPLEHQAMVAWPIGHDVRPANWALGAKGCVECHRPDSPIFTATVTAVGPAPDDNPLQFTMAGLQGIDADRQLVWNQMFARRDQFKLILASSVILTGFMLLAILVRWLAHPVARATQEVQP